VKGEVVETDTIAEIGIDQSGRLYIKPTTKKFPYIYREAMEVTWDTTTDALYSPVPREWSYRDWYRQIVNAATEQGCALMITSETRWTNVPDDLRSKIEGNSN